MGIGMVVVAAAVAAVAVARAGTASAAAYTGVADTPGGCRRSGPGGEDSASVSRR